MQLKMAFTNLCRVPHYFGMKVPPLIRTKTEIREKVALLEALGDIQAALSVLDQPIDVNTHPTDQHYRSLKCDLMPLEKDSEEYQVLCPVIFYLVGKTPLPSPTFHNFDAFLCRNSMITSII